MMLVLSETSVRFGIIAHNFFFKFQEQSLVHLSFSGDTTEPSRLQKKWDGAFVVNLKAPRNGARSTVQLLQKKK